MAGFCKSIDKYGLEKDEDGNPKIEDCQKNNFAMYYTTPESFTLFRSLYHNTSNLQDKFVSYWGHVSKKLAQNQYVVGFDPINEPMFGGSYIIESLRMLFPGQFDKKQLNPLYEKIYKKYKDADEKSIMYFEPGQFPDTMASIPLFNIPIVH